MTFGIKDGALPPISVERCLLYLMPTQRLQAYTTAQSFAQTAQAAF